MISQPDHFHKLRSDTTQRQTTINSIAAQSKSKIPWASCDKMALSHVTHYGGCAVLVNKETFSEVKVKFILQSVLPRASFRRQPPRGQKTSTVLSLHISNVCAKKRGIGKKLILKIRAVILDEKVDLVAGDFNGAAWRRDNSNNISIIEDAFADCALPMPPGPTPLWRPRSIPGSWAGVCGFLKPPDSDGQWKVRQHGVISILHKALGIRPTDQSCHHEACLHLDFVEWRSEQSHRERHDRRILLKERSAPYHHGKQKGHFSDVVSDHSISSSLGDHFAQRKQRVCPHQVT